MCNTSRTRNIPLVIAAVVPALAFAVLALCGRGGPTTRVSTLLSCQHKIASMIVRTRASEIPGAKVARFGKLEPAVSFGVGYRGKPFFIVEWQLEPGAYLPPHCHPNASVCTLGLAGEARIRNFEVVGEAPEFASRKTFLVRETHNEVIAPGRINALSSLRHNIHAFQAGKHGARGIDISTYHGPDVGFSFLDIAPTPKETELRTFEAAWKGQTV
jgi:hypothetical protein